MISIGALELLLTFVLAVGALVAFLFRIRAARWLTAVAGAFGLASIFTPADIVSSLLLASVFLGWFGLGRKVGTLQTSRHV